MKHLLLVLLLCLTASASSAQRFPIPGPGRAAFSGGGGGGFASITGTSYACTALGAHCDCDEPMQSDPGTLHDSNVNFSDSPSGTDCDPTFFGMGGDGTLTMISVAGASGWGNAIWAVDHGWGNGSDHNMNISFKSDTPNIHNFVSSNRSWGVRYYRQFDTAYDRAGGSGCPGGICDATCPPFGTWRNKTFQTAHSNTGAHDGTASLGQMQVQEDPSPAHCSSGDPSSTWVIGGHLSTGSDINNVSIPTLTAQDCDSKPCRFEFMVDTGATSVFTGGGTYTWRTRVCSQETGTCQSQTVTGTDGQFDNFYFWWGADINHSGDSTDLGGSREAYFTSAVWDDVNSSRWIGCDPVVEGNGC